MKKEIFGTMLAVLMLGGGVGKISTYSQNESLADSSIVLTATVNEIKSVQQRLKEWGYYKGAIDGIYGSGTRSAVISFQKKNGLTPDGILGPATARAIGISISNSQTSSQSGSDLYLLAKCVYAEARGEIYQGQVAVAAVILNRVKSPDFPNTIAGVIYQPWAFTAVHDGQINLEPDATAFSAAQDALNGWDPTYGCLYYYNAKTATSQWIFNRTTVVTIGQHVFAI